MSLRRAMKTQSKDPVGGNLFTLQDVSGFESTSSVFLVVYLKPAAIAPGVHVAN